MDPYGIVFNKFALENAKSYLPYLITFLDKKLDLFILSSIIYKIITGHKPFPELNKLDNKEDIKKQYIKGRFPTLNNIIGGYIIYKY